jgi:hypothetical protein
VQQLVVLAIVAVALAYTGRRLWRSVSAGKRRKAGGCGPDCGCGD